ncbi:hypothetical protein NPX13_g3842 [Xylaria arbuscula]|uniref:Membrane anchor Opy2 N-terminal domain-containing protein n=1 Tax=Xylaria arbuscula TaxID=114810 RepID=A0A9W8NHH2_9PEZI|nr:hypothetical protein NPX13_g3842 [Xylaria arbuscula]
MAEIPGFVGFAVDEGSSSFILRRQQGCVLCPDIPPDCPTCADDESCVTISPKCDQCAQTICQYDPSKASSKGSGPNAGAIAGGVIGGLVLVAALTYLLWRFCIKNKRASYVEQWQGEGERTKEHADNDFASRRSQRESTHTYLPFPPIPIAHAESATSSPYEDQHFFVPGDLRDSTYSGISNYTDRTSYARTSYAPRSSVASTIYGKNAVVSPVPAQKGNFLKPSLVSVKSRAASTNSDDSAPPVPSVNYEKYDRPPPSPAFSIGSTFFKNASASTATQVRPQVVRVGTGPRTVDIKASKSTSSSATQSLAELESPGPRTLSPSEATTPGNERESVAVTLIEDDTPTSDQGPFSDPPAVKNGSKRNSSLSAVIEESTRRASQIDPYRKPSAAARNSSPFGDENALRE